MPMFAKADFGCIPQAQLHPAGFLPAVAASLTTRGKNGAVTRRRDPGANELCPGTICVTRPSLASTARLVKQMEPLGATRKNRKREKTPRLANEKENQLNVHFQTSRRGEVVPLDSRLRYRCRLPRPVIPLRACVYSLRHIFRALLLYNDTDIRTWHLSWSERKMFLLSALHGCQSTVDCCCCYIRCRVAFRYYKYSQIFDNQSCLSSFELGAVNGQKRKHL